MTRAEIVAAAERWVGTPYHHQASVRGAGCDCLGLVRGVWRELYGAEPETPPPYSPGWGEAGPVELMLEAARRHMIEKPVVDAFAGDVIVLRMREGRIAKHMAIVADTDTIIHARSGERVERVLLLPYRRRIVAAFSFPGTAD